MSTLGDLMKDQIAKRQKKLANGNDNAEDMSPEDQAAEEEKKNSRWAKIKQILGY